MRQMTVDIVGRVTPPKYLSAGALALQNYIRFWETRPR